MEKFRNSKHQPPLPQAPGNKQVHRQRLPPNLSPDSCSDGGVVADKDSFSFKFGWRSSKQLLGTPIKKLLDEEMSPKSDTKRRSPGVIARLMGLDGLPFQQPISKQHKGLSENQKTPQLQKTRGKGVPYDGGSSRRGLRDQQEFKDVFEVSEIPKVESSRYPSPGCVDLKANDAEMSFIEQKFMDAKRLATHQDLQSSKDFRDTLEVLDSNKDLLLKYFKRPDSLFKKHLNDLQADPVKSHYGDVETMDIEKYEHEHDLSWRSDREKTGLNYNRSHENHLDGYPCHFDKRHVMHSSPRSSKLQFQGRHEQDAVPTKIVLLKPNLGKVQNGTRIVSSPCSHNFLSGREKDTELCQVTNMPESARSWRQDSFESREIAKEITRQMRNSLNNSGMMLSTSRIAGYAGDDSSCSFSGNESPDVSGEITAILGNSFDLNNRTRRSSRSGESSVSKEAKKRLSERWKMTHKSQELQGISRSSTLAEMLAIPDKELKAANFAGMATGEGFRDKFTPNSEPAKWVEPLGISSRDGWKDGCIGSLSRSKSLPSSSTAFGSPRRFLRTEALRADRYMVPKEAHKRERRAAKNFDHRHGNNRNSRSGHKKSWSLHSSKLEVDEFCADSHTVQNKMNIILEDSPKLEVPSAVADEDMEVTNGKVESSEPLNKVLPELSSHVLIEGDGGAVDKDNSIQQDLSAASTGVTVNHETPVPGLESSCCKDADQPSPVSILEPAFTDDLSSCSECFESLNADLQGLRMQLQLLKLESEDYVEGPMTVSDEDGEEVSPGMLAADKGLCLRTEDSWECSYIIDVLSESGIDGVHLDTILEVWHSLECPVSLSVFDELEERYSDGTACSRSQRRLLFDNINIGILKISEQFSFSRSAIRNAIGSNLTKKGFRDGLLRMLVDEGKVRDGGQGNVVVGESEWMDLKVYIDTIAREVERSLLDDLVAEIIGI
ncbi:hypothetical protein PHAVU_007G159500 [Phaseolus vulgaris]|uniref:DUF4378 domain-containing protein n=2 Tax=Phaseolus vulgaris TaxID=3885 RepID=V7BHW6_PHAVU|nr:hypothetical protein PHAVU_007G159500g [Phaseolus vulgaris]ESW16473.1 hypothetical protein PHAVU_007G159500g [Phaseolus vulgaris]